MAISVSSLYSISTKTTNLHR